MQGERLVGRLRNVRRRKQAQNGFTCQVLTQKMRLIRQTRRQHWKP